MKKLYICLLAACLLVCCARAEENELKRRAMMDIT